jgi:hypothetical protein
MAALLPVGVSSSPSVNCITSYFLLEIKQGKSFGVSLFL